eukprot:scaffold103518_cov49-Phaeocystis_antarctica.AAC.2
MAALYLHYEEASPEFTMKCALLPPTRAPPPRAHGRGSGRLRQNLARQGENPPNRINLYMGS